MRSIANVSSFMTVTLSQVGACERAILVGVLPLILPIVVSAALAVPLPAQEPAPAVPPVPTIVTTGEAIVRRVPDVAFVTLAVESRAKWPREAQRLNAEAMNAVQKRAAEAGVPKDALRTVGVWLEQEFDTANGRRIARGFVARSTIEVRLDEVVRAGEIADAMVEAGATSLTGIRFDLRDRAAAEREALRLAVADARSRADAAAAGAGRGVDRVLKIEDLRIEAVAPRPTMYARAQAVPVTDVDPGLLEIQARVTLTVAMK